MNFEEMLKSLQLEYIAALPERATQLEGFIHAKQSSDIRDMFHKLKGTGKTYGLPEISILAELMEEICIRQGKHSLTAAAVALTILREIHASRSRQLAYDIEGDPRLNELRKLLQN